MCEQVEVLGKMVDRKLAHQMGAIDPATGEVFTED